MVSRKDIGLTTSDKHGTRFYNGPVNCSGEIISLEQLSEWRDRLRQAVRKLVVTNGCFDLLHAGHVTYLAQARAYGDLLLVGLNGDASVRALKGEGRPINGEMDRARVLVGLRAVDAVCIFPEKSANRFLGVAQPDVYVKGGDYTLETLDQEERRTVQENGGHIVIIPFVPGKSTTALIQKMRV